MPRLVLRHDFCKDLDGLRRSSRKHYQRTAEILLELQRGVQPSAPRRAESRIPKCEKFELPDGYRLALQRVGSESDNVIVALAVGTHPNIESFISAHMGCVFGATTGRVCELQLAIPAEAAKEEPLFRTSGLTLDDIIIRLNQQRQRATYGAIAGFLGGDVTPKGLMSGRPRNRTNSWVVAATGPGYGRPSRYEEEDIHPECRRQIMERRSDFISDTKILAGWLRAWRR